jgi:heterodisulfide reductase subunit C
LNQIFIDSIEKHGRVYEMGMVVKYNLMTGQPLKDVRLGPSLITKGKIGLLPHKIRELGVIKTLFKKSKRYD